MGRIPTPVIAAIVPAKRNPRASSPPTMSNPPAKGAMSASGTARMAGPPGRRGGLAERLGGGPHGRSGGQQRGDVAEDHTRFGMVGNRSDEGLRAGEFSSIHASTILGGPAQPLAGSGGVLKSSAPDRTLPQSRTYAGRRIP